MIIITQLVLQAFIVYIFAVLICESYVMAGLRDVFNAGLKRIHLTKLTNEGDYEFITCRLCVGFWTTVGTGILLHHSIPISLAAYGLAVYLESTEQQ